MPNPYPNLLLLAPCLSERVCVAGSQQLPVDHLLSKRTLCWHKVCLRECVLQVLEQLTGDHPLPKMILEHRSRHKLLTGFLTDMCSRLRRPSTGAAGEPCYESCH